jgi:hypothetical protein
MRYGARAMHEVESGATKAVRQGRV